MQARSFTHCVKRPIFTGRYSIITCLNSNKHAASLAIIINNIIITIVRLWAGAISLARPQQCGQTEIIPLLLYAATSETPVAQTYSLLLQKQIKTDNSAYFDYWCGSSGGVRVHISICLRCTNSYFTNGWTKWIMC